MRFAAPRSLSPSPVRQPHRSSFRAPSDSEESSDSEDYDIIDEEQDEQSEYVVDVSSESSSEELSSDSEFEDSFRISLSQNRASVSEEKRELDDVVKSIRLRTRYKDPYEDWERETRKDAFHVARKHQASEHAVLRNSQNQARSLVEQRVADIRNKEVEDIRNMVSQMDLRRQQDENRLKEAWKERERKLWEQIDGVIKVEEEKVRAKLEAERKAKEEEERKRKEEEDERQKQIEERKRQEEERLRRLQEEKARKEKEEKERVEREEAEKVRQEQEKGSTAIRDTAGLLGAAELWSAGLRTLKTLKTETMREVKGPKRPDPEPKDYQPPSAPPLKKLWSAQRRKIVPRVGQLTNDAREISRIGEDLKGIVAPIQGTPLTLHFALLSSLAKAIIRQAETEVTAHKEQAIPLARICVSLICHYSDFADILWAKLCELMGCWIAPVAAGPSSESTFLASTTDKALAKMWSRREDESQESQTTRLAGVFRLYCEILISPVEKPLPPVFRPARIWAYIAQLLSNSTLLERPTSPELLSVMLDVCGTEAKTIWGKQWIKLLSYIYECVQGDQKERVGGKDPAAQASRARCVIDIEKILAAS